jgi:hypothetical protein
MCIVAGAHAAGAGADHEWSHECTNAAHSCIRGGRRPFVVGLIRGCADNAHALTEVTECRMG